MNASTAYCFNSVSYFPSLQMFTNSFGFLIRVTVKSGSNSLGNKNLIFIMTFEKISNLKNIAINVKNNENLNNAFHSAPVRKIASLKSAVTTTTKRVKNKPDRHLTKLFLAIHNS